MAKLTGHQQFLKDFIGDPFYEVPSVGKTDLKKVMAIAKKYARMRERERKKGLKSDMVWNDADIDGKLNLIREHLLGVSKK